MLEFQHLKHFHKPYISLQTNLQNNTDMSKIITFKKIIHHMLWLGILLLVMPISMYAQTTRYVSVTGVDTNDGTISNPLKTLQKAVDLSAASDDIINIQSDYTHNGILVTIAKSLTIVGNGVSINSGFNIKSSSDVIINDLTIANISPTQGFYAFNTSEGTTINQVSDNSKLTMNGVTISHTMVTSGVKKNLVGFNLTVGAPTLILTNSTLNLTNESIVYGIYAQSGGPTISVTNTTFNVAITPPGLTGRTMNFIGHQIGADNTLANITLSGNTYNPTFSDVSEQKFFEVLLYAKHSARTNVELNNYLSDIITTGQRAWVWYSNSQNSGGTSNYNFFPSPVQNIDSGLSYNTIQAAINDPLTLNGHTIVVAAGTYTENISITKSLNIRGANYNVNPNDATWNPNSLRVAESIIVGTISSSKQGFH